MATPEDRQSECRRTSPNNPWRVSQQPSSQHQRQQEQEQRQIQGGYDQEQGQSQEQGLRRPRVKPQRSISHPVVPQTPTGTPSPGNDDEAPKRLRRASIRLYRPSVNTPSTLQLPLNTVRDHPSSQWSGGRGISGMVSNQPHVESATTRRRSSSEPRPATSTLLPTARNLPPNQQRPRHSSSMRLVRKTSEMGTSAANGPGTRNDAASDLSTVLEHMQPGEEHTLPPRVNITFENDDSQGPTQSPQYDDSMTGHGVPAPAPAPGTSLQVPEPALGRNRPFSSLRRKRASTVSGLSHHSDLPGRRSRRSSRAGMSDSGGTQPHEEIDSDVVNLLDAIDPEVSTLTTLTNVQNSLFVPHLGSFLNRRPTYVISRSSSDEESGTASPSGTTDFTEDESRVADELSTEADGERRTGEEEGRYETESPTEERESDTIELRRTRTKYMILPDGVNVDGWTEAEKAQLNDHVRHMLHSKRSKFRRGLKGFLQYVSKPLGFLVTLYAVLITLFGLAWVLFLIGWINVGGRQLYIINVIDNVLVALFAIMGDGLAPFRAVDTYHMIFIAHYGHLTWKRRKQRHLKKLKNKNDLPTVHGENLTDLDTEPTDLSEAAEQELSVLTIRQQERLVHHQQKFAKSHTFYKPHETGTHYAFPLNLLIAIVVLLDLHSCFQIALGTCTWSIYYKRRPFALTTVILCCSIACNITAGILIWIGDRRTRKVEVIKRMFRQELTSEAMKKMEKKKRKIQRKAEKQERKSLALSRRSGRSSGETSPRLSAMLSRSPSRSRKRVSGTSDGSERDTIEREKSPTRLSIEEGVSRPSSDCASGSMIDVPPSLGNRLAGHSRQGSRGAVKETFVPPRQSIDQRLRESGRR